MHDPFSRGPFGGFDFMFNLMPIIILIGFVVVFAMIVYGIAGHVRNASAPRKTVYARIAAKRMEVSGSPNLHHHADGSVHHGFRSRTHYYITLEFENGERREFLDVKNLYGLVVEGDVGYAAIQGDWIVAFERQPLAHMERNPGI
jgi:Protein of unknown function (DUF2500).